MGCGSINRYSTLKKTPAIEIFDISDEKSMPKGVSIAKFRSDGQYFTIHFKSISC